MIEEGAVPGKKSTEDLAAWLLWEQIKTAFVLVILGISHLLVGYSMEVWLVGPFWLVLVPYLHQVSCLSCSHHGDSLWCCS